MRENKLRHTFADQLGEAQESDELNSTKEARKLAFYLFWNVRPNFDRYQLNWLTQHVEIVTLNLVSTIAYTSMYTTKEDRAWRHSVAVPLSDYCFGDSLAA